MDLAHLSRTTRLAAATGLAVATAAAIGIGWSLGSGGDLPGNLASSDTTVTTPTPSGASPPPGPSPSAAPSEDPPPSGRGDQTGRGGPANQTGSGGTGHGGSGGNDGGQPEWQGPQIEVFRVTQQPQCPGGTSEYPVEGRPVGLEWQVSGADQVAIAIDGPGEYASYPAQGADTYPFACSGSEGDLQEHTYVLTATADGVTVSETLVVTAEVHEQPQV